MTSRRPFWCPKTMKRRPCWCPKPMLWELNSFLMQTLSFVPKHLHRCWAREWKHSIGPIFSSFRTIYFTQFFLYIADVCKPGWSYFNGICYLTSHSCKNWTEAEKICQAYSANLITVRNQEENVYIQHRLNGAKGWIGLNDRVTEGNFTWADNQTNNFTYWAKNQPNNFNNEDCVRTLGVRHSFIWNDVRCDTCHNYTCSEGLWVTYTSFL